MANTIEFLSYANGLREGLEHADNITKRNALRCIRAGFQLYRELQVKEYRISNLHELKGMTYMLYWTDMITYEQYLKLTKRINELISRESEVI